MKRHHFKWLTNQSSAFLTVELFILEQFFFVFFNCLFARAFQQFTQLFQLARWFVRQFCVLGNRVQSKYGNLKICLKSVKKKICSRSIIENWQKVEIPSIVWIFSKIYSAFNSLLLCSALGWKQHIHSLK